jgi:hypothetical protein
VKLMRRFPAVNRRSNIAGRMTFPLLPPDRRPQDPHMNGTGLRFETLDHGGEYPDLMPQAIRMTDALGRSCLYVPIAQNGKVVDTDAKQFDDDEED